MWRDEPGAHRRRMPVVLRRAIAAGGDLGYSRLVATGIGSSHVLGPRSGDALLVVDVQRDFLPGGRLPVPHGDAIIPVLNRVLALWRERDLPVFVIRDWHPPNHCSFREQGGPWPPHCVAGSEGASLAARLELPPSATLVSKGTRADAEAYSGFEGTDLDARLRAAGIRRLFVGGLATEYCVLATVREALARGYAAVVLEQAIRGLDAAAGAARAAEEEMRRLGASFVREQELRGA